MHHPGCAKSILTDKKTVFRKMPAEVNIVQFDVDPSKTMYSRMLAERQFLESSPFNENIVLLDSDMLIQSNLNHVFSESFDVAMTYRDKNQLLGKRVDLAINGGILFFKEGAQERALSFFSDLLTLFEEKYNTPDLWWWGEQHALMDYVGNENLPDSGIAYLHKNSIKIGLFPGIIYNYSPEAEEVDRGLLADKHILHFKGKRKSLMPTHWKTNMNPDDFDGWWQKVKRSFSNAMSLFKLRGAKGER